MLYQPFLHVLYFTAFTGLPVMIPAIFDRHISEKKIFQFPEVYKKDSLVCILSLHMSTCQFPLTSTLQFSTRMFWLRAAFATVHTAIIFGFVAAALGPDHVSIWTMGSVVYTCVMISITLALVLAIVYVTITPPLYGFYIPLAHVII